MKRKLHNQVAGFHPEIIEENFDYFIIDKDGVRTRYNKRYYGLNELGELVTRVMTIPVPERCLICNSKIMGGADEPGRLMKLHMGVYYNCGAHLTVNSQSDLHCQMLITNCLKSESVKDRRRE